MDVFLLKQPDVDSWNPAPATLLGVFANPEAAEKWLKDNKVHNNHPEGDERNYWWTTMEMSDPHHNTTHPVTGEPWAMYPNRVKDWRYFYIEKVEVQE